MQPQQFGATAYNSVPGLLQLCQSALASGCADPNVADVGLSSAALMAPERLPSWEIVRHLVELVGPERPPLTIVPTASDFEIRPACPADIPAILAMIRALAGYERLSHLCVATERDVAAALFESPPAAEVLVACRHSAPVGFALFFHNYSTFLGRRGLWLEDLFVLPEFRRQGCGRALLRAVARIAVARGCGRFEWAVLEWNAGAVDFYRGFGASMLPDWRIVRLTGMALDRLGREASVPAGSHAP